MLQTDKNHEEIQREIEEKCRCLIPDHHGVYIPEAFISRYRDDVENVDSEILDFLIENDPYEAEFYWERWDKVLNQAKITINGEKYQLAQNGDLFAVKSDLSDDAWDMFYY